ncbi:MAG: hypothetical protein OXR72_04155 [Gemmatimonadota bacterium]|nr:hypothetical protein [Gemmatimonadota bacterium]
MEISMLHLISAVIGAIIASVFHFLRLGLYDQWKNRKSRKFQELYVDLVTAIDTLDSIPKVDIYDPNGLKLYEEAYRGHVSITLAKLELLGIPLPVAFRAELSMPGHVLTSIARQDFLEKIAELSREGKYKEAREIALQSSESL